ncbi:Scr1 family TA system antitoxin-like transcriptional regulator [Kitasatospora sp. NPDC057692]|uniref:helix-turn-helix domain-containing protein n=1 Tax=Kitasatospora sp. NPDC057692 TaxID=3346215 RepID=UPI0036A46601
MFWLEVEMGDHLNRRELDPSSSPRAAFGAQLRSSREAKGWSQQRLADEMGMSDSYISAVETGSKSTSFRFAELADKALDTGQTMQLMWLGLRRRGFLEGFPEHAAQEARAVGIRVFEPNLIPGLFQTPAYTAALETAAVASGSTTPDESEARKKFLAKRQLLHRRPDPPRIQAVIDESGIRRPVGGPATMRAQLDHLVLLAARPYVLLQVAPFSMAEHAPFRAFVTLLQFSDRSVVGYTESAEQGYVVRNDETVRTWEKAYDQVQVDALSRAASLELICKAREELSP